jgi:hypothetical protein
MQARLLLTGIAMTMLLVMSERVTAQIETLVMPGDVIEGHAEYEAECDYCHQAFKRAEQRSLCLDCHEDVATDVDHKTGYHGRHHKALNQDCADCHTDHEGRDADIVLLDEATFEHDFTDFRLVGKHAETECSKCHESGAKYRDAPSQCFTCHEADNTHDDSVSTECGGCHSPLGWTEIGFDHDSTEFPLIGKHLDAACTGCHEERRFENTDTNCYSCHAADDAHDGRSGKECGNCHAPTGWTDTSFDHNRDTDFMIDGKHAEQSCDGCHSEDPFADELDTACVACHLENDNHDGHHGESCKACHASSGWPDVHFDHGIDTKYALRGKHAEAECIACHVEPIFAVALTTDCLACHEEDDAHKGSQGTQCIDCHNETTWQDDVFFDHDLTRFPLLGKHAEVECGECHESHVFHDAPEECVGCHRENDSHAGRFGETCAQCHVPIDWQQWRFDHNTQTTFPLDGAHSIVACESCHRQSLAAQTRLGQNCADCHRSDDIHDGEFGPDCGRCHSADSFRDVRSIR